MTAKAGVDQKPAWLGDKVVVNDIIYLNEVLIERAGVVSKLNDHVKFEYLLDAAHKYVGIRSVRVEVIRVPAGDEGAVVKATVTFGDDTCYEGLGDCDKDNAGSQTKNALLRMAETRAIGRACRHRLNIGVAFEEEKADPPANVAPFRGPAASAPRPTAPRPEAPPADPGRPAPETVDRIKNNLKALGRAADYTRLVADQADEAAAQDLLATLRREREAREVAANGAQ